MVAVVLLTTLIAPLIMRGAFAIHCPQDSEKHNPNENAEEQVDASEYQMIEAQE